MSQYQNISLPYTPAAMKRVIEDALSPQANAHQEEDPPSPASSFRKQTDNLYNTGDTEFQLPLHTDHDLDQRVLPSSPASQVIVADEYSPLLAVERSTPHPFAFPWNPPHTPSPLRQVTATSPNDSSSPFPEYRPNIQGRSQPWLQKPNDPVSSSPIRRADLSSNVYEVEASFLQAMVALLERQANIVPEHLFTKADVQNIVRQELDKQVKAVAPPKIVETPISASNAAYITSNKIMVVTATGAAFGAAWQVLRAHPEEWRWYAEGMFKGAVCGLFSALAMKGILYGSWWRRFTSSSPS